MKRVFNLIYSFLKLIEKGIIKILIYIFKVWDYAFSPWLSFKCRFTPTCSEYGITALKKYGLIKGGYLTIWRILRCNPFCKGGEDRI